MNEKNVSQCDGGKKKLQHRALPILAVYFFFLIGKTNTNINKEDRRNVPDVRSMLWTILLATKYLIR